MNAKNSKPTSVLLPLYATILKDPIFVAVSKDTREMERIVQVGIFSWMFTSFMYKFRNKRVWSERSVYQ